MQLSQHESACAVDRVDDPGKRAIGTLVSSLLAEDAVFRKPRADSRPDQLFGRAVGLRDRIESARSSLVGDIDRAAKILEDFVPGLLCGLHGELDEVD